MNQQTPFVKFIAVVLAQIAIIGLLVAYNYAIVSGGQTLYLKALPVDPTDLIRGDYIVSRFSVSQASLDQFEDMKVSTGETVYVPVKDEGQSGYSYINGEITSSLPNKVESGVIYLKGKVVSGGADAMQGNGLGSFNYGYTPVTISYGIEESFVQKGRGTLPPNANVVAEIKVDAYGNSRVTNLFVDGKKWE